MCCACYVLQNRMCTSGWNEMDGWMDGLRRAIEQKTVMLMMLILNQMNTARHIDCVCVCSFFLGNIPTRNAIEIAFRSQHIRTHTYELL